MGKLNYQLMLLRVRIFFFTRDKICRRIFYHRNNSSQSSLIKDLNRKRFGQLSGMPAEYRIHFDKEEITHYLN